MRVGDVRHEEWERPETLTADGTKAVLEALEKLVRPHDEVLASVIRRLARSEGDHFETESNGLYQPTVGLYAIRRAVMDALMEKL
jgi:hypothetical protein